VAPTPRHAHTRRLVGRRRGAATPNPDLSIGRDGQPCRETEFGNASGKDLDTIHPTDFCFFEDLAIFVDEEHRDAIDSETAGMLAAIGIGHGQPFNPDERMTRILTESAGVGSAMALATSYRTRLGLQRYDDRQWIEIGNTGYPYYEQDGHTMLSGLSLMGWFATGSSAAMG
jgi:hypothetical protein